MSSTLREGFLRRLIAPLALTGALLFPGPTAAKPVAYPRPVYPSTYYRAYPGYPASTYYYSGRLCNRTERRWVPADVRYDRYGNVKRVRGRMVSVRVRVPC